LPEGFYLATSDDIQGLVAQGGTVAETIEIARDVARKLIESQAGHRTTSRLRTIKRKVDIDLVVGA
jgi:predicted RNase H-like HicB family nuclease